MSADSLSELYRRYRAERQADNLSSREFESVLMVFPAILVLHADGHIDTTEMMYLSQLSKHLANIRMNISEQDIRQEIRYLANNIPYWRESFINVLKKYVHEHNLALEVLDIMIAAAGSSTGNVRQNIMIKMRQATQRAVSQQHDSTEDLHAFISEDEKESILNLVQEMSIGADPGVVERLQDLLGN